ncbi:hypothetical protein A359_01580 [secondary endosymbiont of Ctenarytaina eucalypti]|uniref:Uncharacterized protein n=1 Tax=secondary endosymbiont of Ctenarytaina eucalypti TaxID=1199245 RepID=J3VRH7_9ENTR|nr:hypothetical protein A359_01580 [secondary endosymbiont of Ctenarytaina eucalypti]
MFGAIRCRNLFFLFFASGSSLYLRVLSTIDLLRIGKTLTKMPLPSDILCAFLQAIGPCPLYHLGDAWIVYTRIVRKACGYLFN